MLNEKKLHHLPISIGGGFFSLKLSIISRMNQNLGKEILKSANCLKMWYNILTFLVDF